MGECLNKLILQILNLMAEAENMDDTSISSRLLVKSITFEDNNLNLGKRRHQVYSRSASKPRKNKKKRAVLALSMHYRLVRRLQKLVETLIISVLNNKNIEG